MIRHILFWNYTKEVKENHLEKRNTSKIKRIGSNFRRN